jgi:sialic acid synthase SpsE
MQIIGECGCNWKDIAEAKEMIKNLRMIGVEFAKFQLFSPKYAQDNKIPEYLSVSFGEMKELIDYGLSIQQKVFFTPFDVERIGWLQKVKVPMLKIRHADRFNLAMIKYLIEIVNDYRPMLVFSLSEAPQFYKEYLVRQLGADVTKIMFVVLFCVPKYPAKIDDYIKNDMFHLRAVSDHTPDLQLMRLAKRLGFGLFEKHVKLSENCLEKDWSVFIGELASVQSP